MYRLTVKCLMFFSFIFFQINAYADSPSAMLNQLLSKIGTMRADFTQTITDKNAKQVQESVGHMAVKRPGKFRWDVTKPSAQLVVTNGARLWIYDPDLEQVTIRLLTKEVGESPAKLLSDTNVALDKDYDVKVEQKNATSTAFLLIPKNPNSMFASVKLGFTNELLHEMVLQDRIGHTTSVEFYNIRMNPALPETLFAFKAPAHVDVIDETKH